MTESAGLTITESAAKRISDLIQSEGDDGLMLRVAVSSGGCSGFQYGFDLDAAVGGGDLFASVLDGFYDGSRDDRTLALLRRDA